ncbi:MAG: aminodeoxychorismate/anthranilate synthase component II [Actinomycetota bacterium]|nr:aminodeoxychorismate/anthranilate synthase component II [Actinomycetota bacterium]
MKILLIDNYDSFVYNLAQAFGALGVDPVVVRNDASMNELVRVDPAGVVISPGPGDPGAAGVSIEAVESFGARVPVLGVCLGHQCIGAAFGASIARAEVGPRHGKLSDITHDDRGVMRGLPSPFPATRYHSLAVIEGTLPESLEVSAHSEDGTIMGLRHRELPIEGVQFHPESFLCDEGPKLLANFVGSLGEEKAASLS